MSQKRQQDAEGTSFDDRRSRRLSPSFRRLVLKVMHLQRFQNLMTSIVEPLIRRVVNEEVDSALRNHMINMERNCRKDMIPSESRSLRLQFSNAISLPVFTRTYLQGEGGAAIEVALVDALTGQIVSGGPGSSAKLGIVVLEGDFGGDEGGNCTLEEFNRNIVREREGRKPLLIGDAILTLKDGKGLVGDVSFTDNSRWIRSQKFRLGARSMDDIDGIRVREARSEPFVVRNHPRDACMKHYPPSLSDEVWRLKNIRKDGPFQKRLSGERVNTVQDFLVLLSLDPTRLRNIIGTTLSKKDWEVTVQHSRTCGLDKTLYLYNGSTSLETKGVVFNVVREVIGMFKDGQYVITDKLSESEKAHARELVNFAHEHPDQILPLNDEMFLNPPPNLLPSSSTDHQHLSSHNITGSSYSPLFPIGGYFDSDFQCNLDVTGTSYDQSLSFPNQETGALINQCSNYTEADGTIDASIPSSDGLDLMDIRCDQPLSFPSQVTDTLIYDTDSISGAFCANENLNYFDTDSTLNPFVPCSVVPIDKPHKGWNILLYVLRWKRSIKRIVAGNTRVWAV